MFGCGFAALGQSAQLAIIRLKRILITRSIPQNTRRFARQSDFSLYSARRWQ